MDRQVLHVEENSYFSIRTDERGFRVSQEEASIETQEKEERNFVLALGCSTTFGWGVEGHEMWTHLLGKNIDIPVKNAGVPGWSTFQAVHGLKDLKMRRPQMIVMSYGVRDQQLSYFSDEIMKPTPRMFRLQIARLIRKGRGTSRQLVGGNLPQKIARVSVDNYRRNLDKISTMWADVPILYFVFPNLRTRVSRHDRILIEKGGILFSENFRQQDFFEKDNLHLNQRGNQHLSKMLTPHVLKLLGKTKHIE